MPELTLESLAARVAELERKLAAQPPQPTNDWRNFVGIFADDELTAQWAADVEAIRESDRQAAREGRPEESR
jgi:hypothetical protein